MLHGYVDHQTMEVARPAGKKRYPCQRLQGAISRNFTISDSPVNFCVFMREQNDEYIVWYTPVFDVVLQSCRNYHRDACLSSPHCCHAVPSRDSVSRLASTYTLHYAFPFLTWRCS